MAARVGVLGKASPIAGMLLSNPAHFTRQQVSSLVLRSRQQASGSREETESLRLDVSSDVILELR